jgi:hypothetical protein
MQVVKAHSFTSTAHMSGSSILPVQTTRSQDQLSRYQVFTRSARKVQIFTALHERWVANGPIEIYFYADVGNETYDIHDFVEPWPVVWTGL